MDKEFFDLSNAQKRVLVSQEQFQGKPVNNLVGYAIYHGVIDLEFLELAMKRTIDIMDNFSIELGRCGKEIKQKFRRDDQYNIDRINFSLEKDPLKAFYHFIEKFKNYNFSLYGQKLYKIALFKLSGEKYGYIINFHHVIADGWTISLFIERVGVIYDSLVKEHEIDNKNEYSYLQLVEDEKRYLNSEHAKKDKINIQNCISSMEIKKYTNFSQGNPEGERIIKKLNPKEQDALNFLNKRGLNNTVIFSAIIQLLIYYSDNKYMPLINIPNFNRMNFRQKNIGGMYTSTVLAGAKITGIMSINEVLYTMKQSVYKSLRYGRYPYNFIFNEVKKQKPDIDELFTFSINLYNTNLCTKLNGVDGEYFEVYSGYQALPIQIVYKTWNENSPILYIDYRKDCFSNQTIKEIIYFIERMLRIFCENSNWTVEKVKNYLMRESLEFQLSKRMDIPNVKNETLEKKLLNIFDYDKKSIAICDHDMEISYGEFEARILSTILYLKNNFSIKDESKALVMMENSINYISTVYALFFMGITAVLLDKDTKGEFLEVIIDECKPDFAFSEKNIKIGHNIHTIFFDQIKKAYEKNKDIIHQYNIKDLLMQKEDKIAYIIYTSGSTGKPKGVQILRKNLAAYLSWACSLYECEKNIYYMHGSPAFDMSITTLLIPLILGGKIVIGEGIYSLVKNKFADKINIIKATPTQLKLLLKQNCSNVKLELIICGGEILRTDLAEKLKRRFGENVKIFNEYGPTEATIGCTCYLYRSSKEEMVPIGNAVPGTNIYLMNGENLVLRYGIGEICISGNQISKGYINESDEMNSKFVYNSFLKKSIYKTGDLAYFNDRDELVYLGRKNREIKLNGFRISLPWLETVVNSIRNVQNCFAFIEKSDNHEKLAIIIEASDIDKKEIYREIESRMPAYYLPHYLKIVDDMPISSSGKVDICQLEKSMNGHFSTKRIFPEKKEDTVKNIIYRVCEEFLESKLPIDKYDYLQAGGDSIKALLISSALEEKGIQLDLSDLLIVSDINELTKIATNKIDEHFNDTVLPKMFDVSVNIKMLKKYAHNFEKYTQSICFEIQNEYSLERINSAWHELLKVLPIMTYKYNNEKFIKNSIIDNDIILKQLKSKNDDILLNANKQLAILIIWKDERATIYEMQIHHSIVDGLSWVYILNNFYRILENGMVYENQGDRLFQFSLNFRSVPILLEDHFENDFKMIEDKVSLSWLNDRAKKSLIIKSITRALKLKFNEKISLWQEIDVRQSENESAYSKTVGCFAAFTKIISDKEQNIASNIRCVHNEIYDPEKAVRLNYIGNIEEAISHKIDLKKESFAINIERCGGFGCCFEITIYECGGETYLNICTRKNKITYDIMTEIKDIMLNYIEDKEIEALGISREDYYQIFDN